MKVLLCSLALLAVVGTGVALKCFVCNSHTDSACNDLLQKDSPALQKAFVEECPVKDEMQPFCRKVKESIEMHEQSIVRVHRECGYQKREGYECYQKRSEDYIMDVCQCDEDICNGSPALSTPLVPLLAAVAFPLLARVM